jgi:predicted transcriptional regulator
MGTLLQFPKKEQKIKKLSFEEVFGKESADFFDTVIKPKLEFSTVIRRELEKRNLTRQEVSIATGISATEMVLLSTAGKFTVESLVKISKFLGITFDLSKTVIEALNEKGMTRQHVSGVTGVPITDVVSLTSGENVKIDSFLKVISFLKIDFVFEANE